MFADYTLRPDTTQALKITADNYTQVSDWLADNLATDRGVDIVDPSTIGQGQPRLIFKAKDAARHTGRVSVPIPGYLIRHAWDDGTVTYTGQAADMFDDMWQPADPA